MVTIHLRNDEEWIRVVIEEGFATIFVADILSVEIVIKALNRAVAEGATRGTMFTTQMVEDHSAGMHVLRAQRGITWLGGKVTRLADGLSGPTFRIDWDVLPTITE